jgi:nicotinate-nucleotide pyrophosphorylase (carboxylating)
MTLAPIELEAFHRLAAWALEEDLAPAGVDLTSEAILPPGVVGTAVLMARTAGIVAGLPAAEQAFALVDPRLSFQAFVEDGAKVEPGTRLALVNGNMRAMLTAERLALNFLQRLSGVASMARRYVDEVSGLSCKVLDTRKTTPGWRILEKYAVRCGGGHNHRMGLGTGILIKDNHLAALHSALQTTNASADVVAEAVQRVRQEYGEQYPIEIEVDTLAQLERTLAVGPTVVLLDNMPPTQLKQAVARRNALAPSVLLEASGGITLANLRAVAETGVDRVSVGALTHSAVALDIALDYVTGETVSLSP